MAATGAIVPLPASFRRTTITHITLEPDSPGNINIMLGGIWMPPNLIGPQKLPFTVKGILNLLLELQKLFFVLTDIIESDNPVINIVDDLTEALSLGKEHSTTTEIRLTVDTVRRYHRKDGTHKLLLAAIIGDGCAHFF